MLYLSFKGTISSRSEQTFNRTWKSVSYSLRWTQWLKITGSYATTTVLWPYHLRYYFQSLKLALRFHGCPVNHDDIVLFKSISFSYSQITKLTRSNVFSRGIVWHTSAQILGTANYIFLVNRLRSKGVVQRFSKHNIMFDLWRVSHNRLYDSHIPSLNIKRNCFRPFSFGQSIHSYYLHLSDCASLRVNVPQRLLKKKTHSRTLVVTLPGH